ncbi:MAG: hypothetical protein COV76_04875 [Candidatus Omnitrophica bacterium CG11_big_fil_rev_8_21_14_0_20_64_10]|nr:MAG: hypothetical protein COV76_04875 [Candidatus Omnitrophica bacterium CG11_big_fil_rev_8_21_14_0_20_64_10]
MNFRYSRTGLAGSEKRLQRGLEILPGLLSWSVLTGLLALTFIRPLWAALLVIAFLLYWLLRMLYLTLFLIIGYTALTAEQRTDWPAWIRTLEAAGTSGRLEPPPVGEALLERLAWKTHLQESKKALGSGGPIPSPDEIHHLVIFPIAREEKAVYEQGIESLLRQGTPLDRITVFLAVEALAPEPIQKQALEVCRKYRNRFRELRAVFHPAGLPGEARVKGANVTHAAKEAAAFLQEHGIPFDRVIVSCFDADTVVSPAYLACLTYHFMTCPRRNQASFQPIPVYHNNIWEVPGFARVLDVGASFFQLVEATNPEKLVTFSSHSMSFQALVEMDYWPVDMISDDSAIFWKALIHYDGDYRVVPMYVTVSMDVAASEDWRRTAINVYKQKRRWAWGVENFPLVARAFLRNRAIPRRLKIKHLFKLLEGHLAWATWPFILTFIGWLPAITAGRDFSDTVLYYSTPRISLVIYQLASLSLATSVVLSILLLPRPKLRFSVARRALHLIEWLSVPLISILLSALPALDAQTRLMLGRYMEFWVTEKKRRRER